MQQVMFKKLRSDAIPFKYSREEDACMDIYSNTYKVLNPFETAIILTGIAIEIPKDYYGIVKGRSGLSSEGILVHLGTIDHEYRGEIKVTLTNLSDEYFIIKKNMRIAQFTINPCIRINMIETQELNDTVRGTNGYGSSGLY